MKVEVKKLDELKRIIKIEVSGEVLKNDKMQLYRSLGKDLKVPGFRPGLAPPEILERHHSKVLKEEFLKWAMSHYYEDAVKNSGLSPVALSRIFDVDFTDKKLIFSAELEIKPQVFLEESIYKGIKVKDKKVEVKDGEWEKIWENLQENVKKVNPRELSDREIVKWAGYPDKDAFKEAISIEIKDVKLKDRSQDIKIQVVDHLLKKVKLNVPQKVAENHLDKLVNQEIHNLRSRGVSEEDITKYRKDLEEKLKPQVKNQIKIYYILEAISEKENLKVDPNNLYEVVIGYILSFAEFV
ncbi:MAG: hypothetical protein KAS99_00525 [Candidatus Omnitrophica bacterium]|nr:hypothetical protein [Candidatus Omnitrophota bacterium]